MRGCWNPIFRGKLDAKQQQSSYDASSRHNRLNRLNILVIGQITPDTDCLLLDRHVAFNHALRVTNLVPENILSLPNGMTGRGTIPL